MQLDNANTLEIKLSFILGLVKGSIFNDFKPDYAVVVTDCYTDFFTHVIQWSGGDHRVLLGSGFGPSLHRMPTWIRDISYPYLSGLIDHEIRRLQVYNLRDCSHGKTDKLKVLNQKELYIEAVRADTITAVGPVLES